MNAAQKRKQELDDLKVTFVRRASARKSTAAVHTKMVKLTTTQLRSEIRQDKKRRTA
jgi:hypothetical protein